MSNLHYSIWSIWPELSILPKLFFLIFCLICTYIILNAGLVMVRLRSVTRNMKSMDDTSSRASMGQLLTRCTNMGNLITASFYFFGFTFFMALPGATVVIGPSRLPATTFMIRNFLAFFAFAANVFFVMLVLHLMYWFVSGRVRARMLAETSD
jgi:hypothetical protein